MDAVAMLARIAAELEPKRRMMSVRDPYHRMEIIDLKSSGTSEDPMQPGFATTP